VEEEEYIEETEDDGLGYYEDGAKRTLTDEQIAIFRHSEIEASLRDRRHAVEAKADAYESSVATPTDTERDIKMTTFVEANEFSVDLEDGELEDDESISQVPTPASSQHQNNKKNKRKNKNGKKGQQRPPQPKGFFKQNVKPDLRKRTWDVVEAGLGNLDYDEENSGRSAPTHAAQRRRISYDDD
jgi:hypothetical protein